MSATLQALLNELPGHGDPVYVSLKDINFILFDPHQQHVENAEARSPTEAEKQAWVDRHNAVKVITDHSANKKIPRFGAKNFYTNLNGFLGHAKLFQRMFVGDVIFVFDTSTAKRAIQKGKVPTLYSNHSNSVMHFTISVLNPEDGILLDMMVDKFERFQNSFVINFTALIEDLFKPKNKA